MPKLPVALLVALSSLPLFTSLPERAHAQDMPCGAAIRTFVENVGIIFDEMTNVRIEPQFWGQTDQDRQISGYWFFGQPAACPTGGLRVSLWANCEVQNAFTVGGCTIPNVPSESL